MLIDAGPLLSVIDSRQQDHARSKEVFDRVRLPLYATWPCFVEAMHLAGREGGFVFQSALWDLYNRGVVSLYVPSHGEVARMAELMAQYSNVPMDLADASIVAAAEATGERTVFTLDNDFRIYRLTDGSALDIVPQ